MTEELEESDLLPRNGVHSWDSFPTWSPLPTFKKKVPPEIAGLTLYKDYDAHPLAWPLPLLSKPFFCVESFFAIRVGLMGIVRNPMICATNNHLV